MTGGMKRNTPGYGRFKTTVGITIIPPSAQCCKKPKAKAILAKLIPLRNVKRRSYTAPIILPTKLEFALPYLLIPTAKPVRICAPFIFPITTLNMAAGRRLALHPLPSPANRRAGICPVLSAACIGIRLSNFLNYYQPTVGHSSWKSIPNN